MLSSYLAIPSFQACLARSLHEPMVISIRNNLCEKKCYFEYRFLGPVLEIRKAGSSKIVTNPFTLHQLVQQDQVLLEFFVKAKDKYQSRTVQIPFSYSFKERAWLGQGTSEDIKQVLTFNDHSVSFGLLALVFTSQIQVMITDAGKLSFTCLGLGQRVLGQSSSEHYITDDVPIEVIEIIEVKAIKQAKQVKGAKPLLRSTIMSLNQIEDDYSSLPLYPSYETLTSASASFSDASLPLKHVHYSLA